MAASEKLLGDVHEGLANLLKRKIEGALEDVDKQAAMVNDVLVMPRQMSAAEMAIAVALCKNSNITAVKSKTSALGELDALLKGKAKPTEADMEAAMESMDFSGRFN